MLCNACTINHLVVVLHSLIVYAHIIGSYYTYSTSVTTFSSTLMLKREYFQEPRGRRVVNERKEIKKGKK